MKNVLRLLLILGVPLFMFLAGCGGGGGGGSTTTVTGSTVIPATTKVLDDSTSAKVAAIAPDQSTVTLTGTTTQISNLKSGDVLILGVTPATPEGMLKKITGVQKNPDGTTTLQTVAATLEDAVQKASVSHSKTFSADDIVSEVTVAKGVGKAVPLSTSPGELSLQLNGVVVYDRDNNLQTTGDQITVSGRIGFKPTVDLNIEIDSSTLKKFAFSVTGEESSDLTINAKAPAPSLNLKKLLKTYNLGTQTIWIPAAPVPIPIVVTYELGIYVGVKGNISLGLSANANQKLTYTGGVKYENNSWSPINTFTPEFGFQLPTIDASAEAKCFVGPELSTKLYGVAGPFMNIYGYLLLRANPSSTPWWELFGGFAGNAGAKIEMLSGKITARYDVNLFEIEKTLAQAQSPVTFSITGRVTQNGSGLAGVTVSLSGAASKTITTDSSGRYLFSNLVNGSYILTPTLTGYTFSPTQINTVISNSNTTNQDIAANMIATKQYFLSDSIVVCEACSSSSLVDAKRKGILNALSIMKNKIGDVLPLEAPITYHLSGDSICGTANQMINTYGYLTGFWKQYNGQMHVCLFDVEKDKQPVPGVTYPPFNETTAATLISQNLPLHETGHIWFRGRNNSGYKFEEPFVKMLSWEISGLIPYSCSSWSFDPDEYPTKLITDFCSLGFDPSQLDTIYRALSKAALDKGAAISASETADIISRIVGFSVVTSFKSAGIL